MFGLKTGSGQTDAAGTDLGPCGTEITLLGAAKLMLGITFATGGLMF